MHTDGLGSPVASTNAGGLVSRTRYEPYGKTAAGAEPTVGFTGHYNDIETGLTYMQQRYYDPVAGRFLSIDPVTTDANTGGSFNRYAYANNSPYRYIDPDGRQAMAACAAGPLGCIAGALITGAIIIQGAKAARETTVLIQSRAEPKKADNEDASKSDANKAPVPGATGGEKSNTGTRIWDKPGDFGDANRDFDNKNPTNVEGKGNGVRVGTLDDGKRIIVRPGSSDGRPTVEVQRPDGKRSEDKVRYGDKE
jgi:RHS repeat-associated protein